MTTLQLETLKETFRQLMQKARVNGDSYEYFRLSEELSFVEAALNPRPEPFATLVLALA